MLPLFVSLASETVVKPKDKSRYSIAKLPLKNQDIFERVGQTLVNHDTWPKLIPSLSRPQSLLVRHARHCSQCWRRSKKRGCCNGSWLARTYQNLFSPTVKEMYRMLKNFCLLSEAAGPKGFARKSNVSPASVLQDRWKHPYQNVDWLNHGKYSKGVVIFQVRPGTIHIIQYSLPNSWLLAKAWMGPFRNPQTNLLQATSNHDGVSIKVTSVRFQLWKRSKSHPALKVSCEVFWAGYSYTPEN